MLTYCKAFFVFSLHLLYSVPIGASLSSSLVRLEMKLACTCSGKLCCVSLTLKSVAGALFVVGFALVSLRIHNNGRDNTLVQELYLCVSTLASLLCYTVAQKHDSRRWAASSPAHSSPAHRVTGSPAHRLNGSTAHRLNGSPAHRLGEGMYPGRGFLSFFVQNEQATEGWEGREEVKVEALFKWIFDTS